MFCAKIYWNILRQRVNLQPVKIKHMANHRQACCDQRYQDKIAHCILLIGVLWKPALILFMQELISSITSSNYMEWDHRTTILPFMLRSFVLRKPILTLCRQLKLHQMQTAQWLQQMIYFILSPNCNSLEYISLKFLWNSKTMLLLIYRVFVFREPILTVCRH